MRAAWLVSLPPPLTARASALRLNMWCGPAPPPRPPPRPPPPTHSPNRTFVVSAMHSRHLKVYHLGLFCKNPHRVFESIDPRTGRLLYMPCTCCRKDYHHRVLLRANPHCAFEYVAGIRQQMSCVYSGFVFAEYTLIAGNVHCMARMGRRMTEAWSHVTARHFPSKSHVVGDQLSLCVPNGGSLMLYGANTDDRHPEHRASSVSSRLVRFHVGTSITHVSCHSRRATAS